MTVAPRAVGVIGTGAMGMGVVRSLARHRIRTFTRDIRPEANAEAAALGATPTDSAAALAREVDAAILLVVDDRQIDDVLFGERGAAAALRPGSVAIVCSTVDPLFVADLEPRLAAHRVDVLDAPVSGGPAKAANGTMTMMLSGKRDARERCTDLLSRIAGHVFAVGDRPGQAATFKIVNNLLAATNLAAGAEALALAMRAGIDARAALDVINASSGASWIVADRMPRALSGDTSVRAAVKLLTKDVGIAVALAARLGADAPSASVAQRAFQDAVAAGWSEHDDAVLLRLFARRAGLADPSPQR
jgi:3-hydroxyisobutyrate dehydrogenase